MPCLTCNKEFNKPHYTLGILPAPLQSTPAKEGKSHFICSPNWERSLMQRMATIARITFAATLCVGGWAGNRYISPRLSFNRRVIMGIVLGGGIEWMIDRKLASHLMHSYHKQAIEHYEGVLNDSNTLETSSWLHLVSHKGWSHMKLDQSYQGLIDYLSTKNVTDRTTPTSPLECFAEVSFIKEKNDFITSVINRCSSKIEKQYNIKKEDAKKLFDLNALLNRVKKKCEYFDLTNKNVILKLLTLSLPIFPEDRQKENVLTVKKAVGDADFQQYVDSLYQQGLNLCQKSEWEYAIVQFMAVAQLCNQKLNQLDPQTAFDLGKYCFDKKDYENAIKYFELAAPQADESLHPKLYFYLGQISYQNKNREKALDQFKKAKELYEAKDVKSKLDESHITQINKIISALEKKLKTMESATLT